MKKIDVSLEERSYSIFLIQGNSLEGCHTYLSPFLQGRSCMIISDDSVAKVYGNILQKEILKSGASRVTLCSFPAGEQSKNLGTVQSLYSHAVASGIDRKSVIVGLGGGVVGDTAGFVAATYMRGVDFLQIPTSLLAYVDSSIGGKTGIDLREGKNLVGAFLQPKAVLIDTTTLKTLPPRQIRCGLAEVIKYAIILDKSLFELLYGSTEKLCNGDLSVYEEVIFRCCQLKAKIVGEDEYDRTGRRAMLNYGHTFGHAIEMLSNYQAITHGEAIAIGMGMAADLSVKIEPTARKRELVKKQNDLLKNVGLPTTIQGHYPEDIIDAMKKDKKTENGKIHLILPEKIGRVHLVGDVPDQLILAAIGGRCVR